MSFIWNRNTFCIFTLITLSGCLSMTQKEKSENVQVFPSMQKTLQEGLDSGVFVEGSFPSDHWWEFFQSPILTEWVEIAFKDNPSLSTVSYRVEQAKQQAKVARAGLFPTLYFDPLDNYRYLSENGFTHLLNTSLPLNGYEASLSLDFFYEFDFWGKYRNLFRAALGEAKAQEAEYNQAKLVLSTAIAQSYFSLFIHLKKEKLYQELVQIRKKRFNLEVKMQSSALFSSIPPLFSDETVKEAEQLLISIQDEIEVEKHLINLFLGRGPDEELNMNLEAANPQLVPIPTTLSSDLLFRRPDLMAQIWRAEALAAQVGVAKADFYPDINLAAFAGILSSSWSTLFQNHSKTAGYRPAVHLPIFVGGSIRANLAEKKAAFDSAIQDYNNLLLTAAGEVADSMVNIQTVYKQKNGKKKW